jgi:26S proteasome regulatory subunit T2
MGNQQAGGGGLPFGQPGKGQGKDKKKDENQEKRRIEPPAQRVCRKKKKRGVDTATKLPNITPTTRFRLRLL